MTKTVEPTAAVLAKDESQPKRKKKKKRQPFEVSVRGISQPRYKGQVFKAAEPLKAFDEALAFADCTESEPLIEWRGLERLAVLDIDYHGVEKPDNVYLVMAKAQPQPERWWVSHGGGLKLLYAAKGRMTAEDQAAIARYILRRADIRESGMEIQSTTRHPAYPRGEDRCGQVSIGDRIDGLAAAKRILLGDIDPDAETDPEIVGAWLEENGWVKGQRYSHDRCPIEPNETGERDPVQVGDKGIICHRCRGKGVAYGGMSTPGFVPWRVLIEAEPVRVRNDLRNAVKGLCHWEHARHIIDNKSAYRALLRLWHVEGAKLPRTAGALVEKVFFPEIPLVRAGGVWLRSDSLEPAARDGLDKLLQCLPAVRYVAGKGKTPLSQHTLGMFQGDYDLTGHGYPAVTPLRGVDIAESVRPFDDPRIYAAVPANPPFMYRSKDKRDMAAVEAEIKRCYPGVNLNLLRLLTACKGLVQRGDLIDVPQVFITGQSGAGKSMTVRLAAEIACDRVDELRPPSADRLLQAYAAASDSCSYALFNEASKSGVSGKQLRDYCLAFTRGVKYHRLYFGQQRIDNPAVVVMTDPHVPDELRLDEQTGRRIALIDLGAGATTADTDWRLTCGTGTVERWRAGGNADAADTFLSDIIDRYFRNPSWTFDRIVEDLGFLMMSRQAEEQHDDLRQFYELVTALPEHDGSSRWKGPGWRVFGRDDHSRWAELYRDLTDQGKDVQPLLGAKWGRIVGKPGMTCKVTVHRAQVGVKFTAEGA